MADSWDEEVAEWYLSASNTLWTPHGLLLSTNSGNREFAKSVTRTRAVKGHPGEPVEPFKVRQAAKKFKAFAESKPARETVAKLSGNLDGMSLLILPTYTAPNSVFEDHERRALSPVVLLRYDA